MANYDNSNCKILAKWWGVSARFLKQISFYSMQLGLQTVAPRF